MRRYKTITIIGAALLLLFCGCAKEELTEGAAAAGRIGFSAVSGSVGESDCDAKAAMESQVIELRSEDGSVVIPMVVRVSDGIGTGGTKGQLINGRALQDTLDTFNVQAFKNGSTVFDAADSVATWNTTKGRWDMARYYYWPEMTDLDFYAYANMPAKEIAYVKLKESEHKQMLHYEVPGHTDDQTDILLAVYSGNGNAAGDAELNFYHPLSAVQFRRDPSAADLEGTISITMEGVYYIGEVDQTMSNPGVFTWRLIEKGQTVTQDNHGLPLVVHGGIDGDPFLIIPQTVGATSRILLRVTLLINGHNIPLNAFIDLAVWEPGKTYTYVIGYTGGLKVELEETSPSEEVKRNVIVKNTDVKTAYVRAMVLGYITDAEGRIKSMWLNDDGTNKGTFTVASGTFDSTTEAWNKRDDGKGGWIKGGDGYYYYKRPIKTAAEGSNGDPDSQTTPLFNEYSITNVGTNNHFQMDIAVQSVEYDAQKDFVKATWGDDAAALLETLE